MTARNSYLAERTARRQRRVTAGLLAASALATAGLWALNLLAEVASAEAVVSSPATVPAAGRSADPAGTEPLARLVASGEQP